MKRLLAILLSLAMIFALLPTSVFAEEEPVALVTTANGTVTEYETFTDALITAQESIGSTLTLLDDFETLDGGHTFYIQISKGDFTLDLNGFGMSADSLGVIQINGETKTKLSVVNSGDKNSVIKDMQFEVSNDNELKLGDNVTINNGICVGINGTSKLTIDGAELNANPGLFAISVGGQASTVEILSGTISAPIAIEAYGAPASSVTISGGTINASCGISIAYGTNQSIAIKGGVFNCGVDGTAASATITMSKGTIGDNVKISGGDFTNGFIAVKENDSYVMKPVNPKALLANEYSFYNQVDDMIEINDEATKIDEYTYVANAPRAVDYNITVAAKNGTVLAPKTAKEGDTVEISCTPDKGYHFISIKADGITFKKVNGRYQFTMPASDVAITVTFARNSSGGGLTGGSTTDDDDDVDQGISDDPTIDTILPDGTIIPGRKDPIIIVDPDNGATENPKTGDSIFANLFSFLFN